MELPSRRKTIVVEESGALHLGTLDLIPFHTKNRIPRPRDYLKRRVSDKQNLHHSVTFKREAHGQNSIDSIVFLLLYLAPAKANSAYRVALLYDSGGSTLVQQTSASSMGARADSSMKY